MLGTSKRSERASQRIRPVAAALLAGLAAACLASEPAAPGSGSGIPGSVSVERSVVSVSRDVLAVGETATITLEARDSSDQPYLAGELAVAFSLSGGTSEGTLTPTVDTGDGRFLATFRAVSAGSPVTVGATINDIQVTSPPPSIQVVSGEVPPPPAPGDSILFFEGFEDADFAARGWYDLRSPVLTDAEHIPGSTRSLELRFEESAQTPVGSVGRHLFAESDAFVLSYWVKYSANWVGSQRTFHPHEFYFLTNLDGPYVGPASAHLELLVEQNHNGIDGMVPLVGVRGRRMWGAELFTDAPGPRYKGDWHHVEVLVEMNSAIGVPDGIVRYWLDGQLIIDESDVLIRTEDGDDAMLFNQLLVGPYIGSGSPVEQTLWIDDLSVRTG